MVLVSENLEGEETELKKMEELVEQSAYHEMYYSELQKYKDVTSIPSNSFF